MMGGSTIITESWRTNIPAIMMLWYPGMEGGRAFADILLGKVNPSGRLPCIFPAQAEDLPEYRIDTQAMTYDMWHGYRKLERESIRPAFPFGFGLSYTTYGYTNLCLEKSHLTQEEALTATLEVKNTGHAAGDTVIQCYISVSESRVERAPKELKAFQRVSLEPGQTKTVNIQIPLKELAYFDPKAGWTVEPAEYTLIVGQHSLDEHALHSGFTVA